MNFEETAKRIQFALNQKDLNQQELANKSGVGKASISQYMHGRNRPDNVRAYKLSQVLGVSPEWLMGFDVPMKKEIPQYTEETLNLEIKFSKLTKDNKKSVIDMIDFLLSQQND